MISWGSLVLLALAVFVAALVLPGCTADTPELELADEDRAALASLGYVANELRESGGTDTEKRVLVLGIDGMDWLITTRLTVSAWTA